MLINTKEIISIINKKREKIHKCVSNFRNKGVFCLTTLVDENNELLTVGTDGTGSSEYGDIVYWDEKVTIGEQRLPLLLL